MTSQTTFQTNSGSSNRRPPHRRLRVYAFDPSLDTQMDTAVINRATLKVPWEHDRQTGQDTLEPGPVGEYLEVVDFDPASNCFYAPVDLNDHYLLAQDGLEPSEGNPQFHQQMVYAVAMTTIRNFERALGRRALWSPRRIRKNNRIVDDVYVRRLRVYPHALRQANAYYSPAKKALLFGYFPASATVDPGKHLPSGMVFTCLSHDVIAHETTHALLDGMHRRFIEPSNPDVLAFHEAFADIVALFQHFSFPEVLRHQIARTRGDLAGQSLLGQLAQQFGQATGRYGALRDALGAVNPETKQWEPSPADPRELDRTFEPHARGALLVAAVFDAFLSIYKSRVEDLLRIATSGTGVLPAGQIHPDLVNRLANEAAKSAQHILNMCIRALDYCPPVDLTFGEYLRALITADHDLVPEDERGYRIAVIEAFRRRGIYPRDVRTLSVDSLRWQAPKEDLSKAPLLVDKLHDFMRTWDLHRERETIFKETEQAQRDLHGWIEEWLEDGIARGRKDEMEKLLGIEVKPAGKRQKFEIHSMRPTRRIGPEGESVVEMVIEITQKRWVPFDDVAENTEPVERSPRNGFTFRGGCTLVVNIENREIRYAVRKDINRITRLERQRKYLSGGAVPSLQATYFGHVERDNNEFTEPFAFLHGWAGEEEMA